MRAPVGEVVGFDLGLDALELGDVGLGRHADEPARQRRLDQHLDLVDVADEVLVDRPDAGAAIGRHHHEALAAQLLQRLAHRVGRGLEALGELVDLEPLVGGEPAGDDFVADQLVDRAGFRKLRAGWL